MKADQNGNVVPQDVESSPGFTMVRNPFRRGAVSFFDGVVLARSPSMKRYLSPSDVAIGPVNWKNRILSLPRTAPPLIANMKVEDVVAENTSESGFELSYAGRNAYKQLETAIKPGPCCTTLYFTVSKDARGCGTVRGGYHGGCQFCDL